jgi:hypothetical protein
MNENSNTVWCGGTAWCACNLCTLKAKAGGLRVLGQPGLYRDPVSKKQK